MVYMKLGRPWEERVESLWDNQTSYSEAMLSHLLYCLSLDIDFFVLDMKKSSLLCLCVLDVYHWSA